MEYNKKSEDRYFNGYFGREVFDVFRKAGLADVIVEAFVPPLSCNYPGSEYFEWRRMMNKSWFDPERRRSSPAYEDGAIDDKTIERAKKEIEIWCEHPGVFFMITSVLAAGSVK